MLRVLVASLFLVTILTASSLAIVHKNHQKKKEEGFCATTSITYREGGSKIPDLSKISRQPPFYDLNATRPPQCSYRNYTYPVPIDYPSMMPISSCGREENKKLAARYLYWYSDAMLSHPSTSYLV